MNLSLSNSSTIDTNGSSAALSGILSGNGDLTKSGSGTLYFGRRGGRCIKESSGHKATPF